MHRAMLDRTDEKASSAQGAGSPASPRIRIGLTQRVLMLIVSFVMLSEIAVYVPSIANFRNNWLRDRLAAARTAALVNTFRTPRVPASEFTTWLD